MANNHPREQLTTKALIVWFGAVAVYAVAILGRTSFGVASVEAIDRFNVDASRIAVFTAVQVGVYAFAQIPTGLLIDRLGPRFMLVAGAIIMAVGQIVLGLTTSYGVAIVARVLIGAGDATAFLSGMRILPYWFPPRKTPLFTQLTAALGQLGQFLSAVPFLALLTAKGWTVSFVSLGALGLLIALLAAIAVADTPEWAEMTPGQRREIKQQRQDDRTPMKEVLGVVLRSPIAWEAFFIHGWVIFWMFSFCLLWGLPLMTLGMGLTESQAGTVLILFTVVNIASAPFVGAVSARMGSSRDLGALILGGVTPLAWIIFFLPSEPRSYAAILTMSIIMGLCVPTSNFGFDAVRENLPTNMVATGTGLGNMGGFVATMIGAQTVGVLLDHSSHGQAYQWHDFQLAWIAFYVTAAVLLIGLLVSRRKARRLTAAPHVRIVNEAPAERQKLQQA
ncbi:nitrate/nitrite transporter [Corynebacterium sp. NML180780]|uniref:MFS transporter n=1 Tax=Corynebacterium sp. NML180780 TaxID=2598459 RepID=UPI001193DDE6|nr:MFS transporter [Corynebacterium sp. NML180780]TVX79270.1 MFS transporter [Corynebacterium sp. NML180780]